MGTRQGTCTYCRGSGLITKDHVIPHGLFPGIPHNQPLPKVPACPKCQERYSKDEGYFRAAVIAESSGRNIGGTSHVYQTTLSGLRKDARLAREVASRVQSVFGLANSGLWVPRRTLSPDQDRLAVVFWKLCVGLYVHRTRTLPPLDMRISHIAKYTEAVDPKSLPGQTFFAFAALNKWSVQDVAYGGQKWAEWTLAEIAGHPGQGIWFFRFHEGASWLVFASTPAAVMDGL